MRSAVGAAQTAQKTAADTGATLGGEAQNIGGAITPVLTQEMLHPQGFGQADEAAMLAASQAGAGGADAGIVGEANQEAATTRNAGGFQTALDDAARQRMKAAAQGSESIAGQNAQLKQQQMQHGEEGLQKLYGTDTSGMLDSYGQQAGDINAEVGADKQGWLQNAMAIIQTLNGSANSAANLMKAGGAGAGG